MSRKVVVIGLGRSGTSWCLKVFDHSPDVLTVFEPRNARSVDFVSASNSETVARQAVSKSLTDRTLRAMRSRPIRSKSFRTAGAHWARVAYMYGASVLTDVLSVSNSNRIDVPDFEKTEAPATVAKLVNLVDRLPEMARSSPNVHFALVLRHPCGYVASNMKGMQLGKMPAAYLPRRELLDDLYSFEKPARELTESDFEQLDIFAMRWAAMYHAAIAGTEGLANVSLHSYDAICEDPIAGFKDLFAASGVDWHPDCEDFLSTSLRTQSDSDQFHGLVRNPAIAANRWRETLSEADKSVILKYALPSAAAQLFPDLSATHQAAE